MAVSADGSLTVTVASLLAATRDHVQLLIQGGKCTGTGGLVDRSPLASLPEAGPSRSKNPPLDALQAQDTVSTVKFMGRNCSLGEREAEGMLSM